MSRYLANLRTADIYTGLKKGVTNALQQVPVMGDRMIEHIRKTKSSIKQLVVPGMFFEDMGITYLGPIPGHNLPMLCKALKEAKKVEGPVLLHVMTTKGKGYEPAETAPDKFHGIGPFDIESGKVLAKKTEILIQMCLVKCFVTRHPEIQILWQSQLPWQMEPDLPDLRSIIPNRFFVLELRKNTV